MGDQFDSLSDSGSESGAGVRSGSVTENETPDRPRALLAEDPFSNETSKRLFDAMDELRGCGVGQDLDLPQVRLSAKIIIYKISITNGA
jgi:hypothetical protein